MSPYPSVTRSFVDGLARYWFPAFLVIYGLWIWLPVVAPVFMHLGLTGAGKAIYLIYSFFCHQLPKRSFFLFGQKTIYSLSKIQAA